jgi:hypothetical protein
MIRIRRAPHSFAFCANAWVRRQFSMTANAWLHTSRFGLLVSDPAERPSCSSFCCLRLEPPPY